MDRLAVRRQKQLDLKIFRYVEGINTVHFAHGISVICCDFMRTLLLHSVTSLLKYLYICDTAETRVSPRVERAGIDQKLTRKQ